LRLLKNEDIFMLLWRYICCYEDMFLMFICLLCLNADVKIRVQK